MKSPIKFSLLFLVILASVCSHVRRDVFADEPSTTPLILAHYMPWYAAKPVSPQWGWHWTMNHFDPDQPFGGNRASKKRSVASKLYPLIGPYDSSDPDVIEFHLLLMKTAGIDGVIVDWYGLQAFNDYPMLHRNTSLLIEQADKMGMKFAVCYEDQTLLPLIKAGIVAESDRVAHVASEIRWLKENWFNRKNHVSLDGKPVMLSFGNAGLSNEEWTECIAGLDFPIAYFSEHHPRIGATGAFDWPIPGPGMDAVDRFIRDAPQWNAAIPVAFPRFVDIYAEAKVNEGYPDIVDDDGATMRTSFEKALAMKPQMIQIATWNDWGEGTVIEPSREYGYRDLDWIQKTMVQHRAIPNSINAADIRLPALLLAKRRKGTEASEKLDQISDLIVSGQFQKARVQLEVTATD